MTLGVHSEVGTLRKVIVHRPDLSMKRLTPTNADRLLFDDILWVEHAQKEHDAFVAVMRERGIEVYYHQQLLAEALDSGFEAKQHAIEQAVTHLTVGPALVDTIRRRSPAGRATSSPPTSSAVSPSRSTARRTWTGVPWWPRRPGPASSCCRPCPTPSTSAIPRPGSTAACR